MISMISAAWRALQLCSPRSAPMRLPLYPRSAPWSHDLGRPWLLLPTFCMPTWQPHLPALASSAIESLVCLGQSFVQVLDRAKSSPWLAQAVARCRIRICVQAANVFAAEFLDRPRSRQPMPLTSFPAWLGHSIVKPMFVNNLRCWFSFDEPIAT